MNDIKAIIKTIVEHQEGVIGTLAVDQANKVPGISISDGNNIKVQVSEKGTNKLLIDLVEQYEKLFGKASVEVCRDAIKEIKQDIDVNELPEILR